MNMESTLPRFICPSCKEYIFGHVTDTRAGDDGLYRWRRCEECGVTFVTAERFERLARKTKRGEDRNGQTA